MIDSADPMAAFTPEEIDALVVALTERLDRLRALPAEFVEPASRMTPEKAALLRAPFPESAVGKLPRVTCAQCRDNKTGRDCQRHTKIECRECHQYMTPAHIHLDYVGHAAVTDRLLLVDPDWAWEPVAFDPSGAPLIQRGEKQARMWIRLTICGVTRLGVGIAESWKPEVEKELISDAIRNAAMRFGVALDLWSKEDLTTQAREEADGPPPPPPATHQTNGDPTNVDMSVIKQVTTRLDTFSPEQREAIVAWKDAQHFPWPWPRAACVAMMRYMDDVEGVGSQDPTSAPGVPPEPLPPAEDLPVDGPCELCGSTRAAKTIVHGVRRCQNASDCRRRVEKANEDAAAESSAQGPETTDSPAAPPVETGDEVLYCSIVDCGLPIVGELPVFGDSDEPYHAACSPQFSEPTST